MPNAWEHSHWAHGLPWPWLWWVLADKWEGHEEKGRGSINKEMQALGQRFGMRSSWLSLTFIVWDSAVSNYKKKCACPGMLPIQWILMDVTWNESSALLKCITSTVQCCVDLDFVFHCIHYLPKSDFCWMHSIFLTAVEFSFGRQNNSECYSCTKSLL